MIMKLVFGWGSRYVASVGRFDWYINEKYLKKKQNNMVIKSNDMMPLDMGEISVRIAQCGVGTICASPGWLIGFNISFFLYI